MYIGEGTGLLGTAAMPGYNSVDANDTGFSSRRRKRRSDDAGGVDESALSGLSVNPRKTQPAYEGAGPAPGAPVAAPAAAPRAPVVTTPTFSELRMSGRARPAPPPRPMMAPRPAGPAYDGGALDAAQARAIANAQAPSRYDNAAVMQAQQLFDQRLMRQGEDSQRTLDEQASSRGLFDSSVALDQSRRLQESMGNTRAQFANDMLKERANTAAQDNAAAIQALFGLANQKRSAYESDRTYGTDVFNADRNYANDVYAQDRNYERDAYNDETDLLLKQYGLGLDRDRLGLEGDRVDISRTGQDRNQLLDLLRLFGDPSVALTDGVL